MIGTRKAQTRHLIQIWIFCEIIQEIRRLPKYVLEKLERSISLYVRRRILKVLDNRLKYRQMKNQRRYRRVKHYT
ncbi:hypothetical protein AGR7B_Lc160044 [Agrobacterium deltaense RV3]|nr:hypothetical protein AGR7B_Lc160044 [Agrobacterium deltaense RV3]